MAENTSESDIAPSGVLHAIDVGGRNIIAPCDLGAQPDSTAIAPDGSFITVVIANEGDMDGASRGFTAFHRAAQRVAGG
ncbi:hypothetical protein [Roseicyclus sp.]|uniref:hypothetical protein n=1 Tax=Roseicyclus sp. TaxID=1914329 RepID=UPI001BD109F2|nr:hypothetical protein [Roseicyclus sp.]